LNPFDDPALVEGYEDWYQTTNRRADRLEKALLGRLLAGFPQARSALEVGCGTGHFTRWMASRGLQVVGLDISQAMLTEAVRLGSRCLVRGNASTLPFATGAFDLVTLITTLEFAPDPGLAVTEALRVARYGLILGVLNRDSKLGRELKSTGGPIWDVARFFTPAELARLVRDAAAGRRVEIVWRTTLWPLWPGALPLPRGGFIGMAARLA
jgi:ubiquinone/menaquinone biosynthesis C-methylase UbiE